LFAVKGICIPEGEAATRLPVESKTNKSSLQQGKPPRPLFWIYAKSAKPGKTVTAKKLLAAIARHKETYTELPWFPRLPVKIPAVTLHYSNTFKCLGVNESAAVRKIPARTIAPGVFNKCSFCSSLQHF
jgi:hypothetical protein